jgi:hypothetical protein
VASLFDKVSRLARSPQGQRLIGKAQELANDPATREKVQRLRDEVTRRAGRSRPAGERPRTQDDGDPGTDRTR